MAQNPYRSRLARAEEQRSVRRSFVFVLLTLGIVVVMIAVGLQLLTRLTGFFVGRNSTAVVDDTIPPAPPQLAAPYQATNSATLALKGRAEPQSVVYVTRNGTSIGNQTVNDQGEFMFPDVSLLDGSNQFIAVAMDQAGNKSQQSLPFSVVFSTTLPKLEVSQPTEGQIVNGTNTQFELKGLTEPGNKVTVNDRVLIVSSTGAFSTFITLNEGDNKVMVVATNTVGNISQKEILVRYRP